MKLQDKLLLRFSDLYDRTGLRTLAVACHLMHLLSLGQLLTDIEGALQR